MGQNMAKISVFHAARSGIKRWHTGRVVVITIKRWLVISICQCNQSAFFVPFDSNRVDLRKSVVRQVFRLQQPLRKRADNRGPFRNDSSLHTAEFQDHNSRIVWDLSPKFGTRDYWNDQPKLIWAVISNSRIHIRKSRSLQNQYQSHNQYKYYN